MQLDGFAIGERLAVGRHLLLRARRERDDLPVVLKVPTEALDPAQATARLRHELEIAGPLSPDAVVQPLELVAFDESAVLVLADPGGTTLAARTGRPLTLEAFLPLAESAARALGAVHAAGVLHKDVKPDNAVVLPDGSVRWTDFGVASRQELVHHDGPPVGTLAYMAPEQTGRMRRQVDLRSDLYALGVTFYELLAGVRPFTATDPMELVHAHIAKEPAPLGTLRADLPPALDRIVLRLLQKSADDRYQTSAGLLADLRRCAEEHARGEASDFALGAFDRAPTFRLPQRLVGRDAELDLLTAAWTEALGGPVAVVALEGKAGLGKSALVGELRPAIAAERGQLLHGSCEELGHDVPWAPLLRGVADLVERLLRGSEASIDAWRRAIEDHVGSSARVLADVVPELELLTGPLPAVAELTPAEAEVRFTGALRRLLQVLAGPDHPLVLFLDDVQWADGALLRLVGDVATDGATRHLLLVLAWRDADLPAAHPVVGLLDRIGSAHRIRLAGLEPAHLVDWLADGLRCPPEQAAPLAALVHAKTGGNPFFVEQLLRRLQADDLITSEGSGWRVDPRAVEQSDLADHVAELLQQDLDRLPRATREALALAACLGARFALDQLADALQISRSAACDALESAVAGGLLIALDEAWRYRDPAGGRVHHRFAHDRIREAAYGSIPASERSARHVAIARQLAQDLEAHPERLLDVVGHYERGLALVTPSEAPAVAALFGRAARRALDTVATATAATLSRDGLALLGSDPWSGAPDLARDLTLAAAEAAFLSGDLPAMEAATDALLAHASTPDQRVDALELRLHAFSHVARHDDALDACCDALAALGHPVPRRPSPLRGGLELIAQSMRLRGFQPEDLAELPPMNDPRMLRALKVMLMVGAAAQARSPGMFALVLARSVGLSIKHGLAPEAPLTYLSYGFALSVVLGQRETGYRFGQEALRLLGPPERSPLSASIITIFNTYIRHWREPRNHSLEAYATALRAALQNGDLEYYGYNIAAWCFTASMSSERLGPTTRTIASHHRELARTRQVKMHGAVGALREELARLTGPADPPVPPAPLDGVDADAVARAAEDDYVQFLVDTTRSLYALLRGDVDVALDRARAARAQDKGVFGSHQFYGLTWRMTGVVAAAERAAAHPTERRVLRRWSRGPMKELRKAAAEAPFNYALMDRLAVSAWASVDGDVGTALQAAQQAVDLAREHRIHGLEALAALRAAAVHERARLPSTARSWRRAARTALQRWGAHAAVAAIDEADPTLRTVRDRGRSLMATGSESSESTSAVHGELDLGSLLKAGQAISREILLDRLLERLLQVAIENAGATRASIVLTGAEAPFIAARSDGGPQEPLEETDALPAAVIRYALRTGRDVVLADATATGLFTDDPWVRAHEPKSILAVPLLHQNRATAAIYLENPLTAGAFTSRRVAVMRSLATQAAIAVENARLYASQLALTKAQSRFVPHQFLRSLDREDIVEVQLGDHVERDMAVLFSDLRGFTTLSERLGPRRTLEVLNQYLEAMQPSIRATGGFVDKYIGDAILALFEQGPDAGVRAAVGMCAALRALNQDMEEPLAMGIGINAGPLTLGTIGAQDRVSCTVIGDCVNLAARLEGLTKTFGCSVLISEYARERMGHPDQVHLRIVGRVAVKGRQEPLDILEVVDAEPSEVREARLRTREAYDLGVARFFAGEFKNAITIFETVLTMDPDDGAAARFLERAERLAEAPVVPGWTGVERQVHK